MNEDTSTLDVQPGADSSDALASPSDVSAPAGGTAASPVSAPETPPPAAASYEDWVPKARFREVIEKRREIEAQLTAKAKAEEQWKAREAELQAELQRARAEPPPWAQKLWAPKEEVPDFGGDPALEKAWRLEKALEERDKRLETLTKRLEDLDTSHKTYAQKQEEERQLARFEAKLEADFRVEAARTPGMDPDVVYGFIAEGRARNMADAAALYRYYYPAHPGPAAAAPVVRPTSAPPVASAAAPSRPGPVRSSPATVVPAPPPPKSFEDMVAQARSKYA